MLSLCALAVQDLPAKIGTACLARCIAATTAPVLAPIAGIGRALAAFGRVFSELSGTSSPALAIHVKHACLRHVAESCQQSAVHMLSWPSLPACSLSGTAPL